MSRYLATFYHFLVSLAVFVVLAWFIFFRWFPDFFYAIDGGWEGLRIIILVDLVLGPLLTLIVFKAGKPGLLFDLILIGIVQVVCLAGGIYIVYNERPTFFVFYEGHFYSASASSYHNYGKTAPDPDRYGGAPAYIYVDMPTNPIEEADIRKIYYDDRVPLWTASEYYERLERHMDEVLKAGNAEEKIRKRDSTNNLDRWLARHEGSFEDYAFVPIHSRYRKAYIAIDRADMTFEGLLEVEPPPVELPPKELEDSP